MLNDIVLMTYIDAIYAIKQHSLGNHLKRDLISLKGINAMYPFSSPMISNLDSSDMPENFM